MWYQFSKMHGLGNDFVVFDGISTPLSFSTQQLRYIADRHTGIGCDQILLVEPSQESDCDFYYRIYNGDGQCVEQCGNGARCVARFVFEKGLSDKKSLRWQTLKGTMVTTRILDNLYQVDMGAPDFVPAHIPFAVLEQAVQYHVKCGTQILTGGAVSMGNPHFVIEVDVLEEAKVNEIGPLLNQSPLFPEGVNVGFMQRLSEQQIKLRVYERGVGETLACGTGACAAVSVGCLQGLLQSPVDVILPKGNLMIHWEETSGSILMSGPAENVFQGQIDLK